MIAQVFDKRITSEEYLAFEAKSAFRHEYIDGMVYERAEITDVHNIISQNVAIALRLHLKGSNCSVYMSAVKAYLEERENYYYPDIFVTCSPADQATPNFKRFPKLIVEVLSDSTEACDRGDKFADYQSFESLEKFVLVNTRRKRVEVFRRLESGLWAMKMYQGGDSEIVEFESLSLKVPLAVVYEDIRLPGKGEAIALIDQGTRIEQNPQLER